MVRPLTRYRRDCVCPSVCMPQRYEHKGRAALPQQKHRACAQPCSPDQAAIITRAGPCESCALTDSFLP